MKRRTLCLLLALMLTAQLVLPAAAEAVELQPTEETVAQELPEETEAPEETETPEETEEAPEVPEETEEPAETEETEVPAETEEIAEDEAFLSSIQITYNVGEGTGAPEDQAVGEDGKVLLSWKRPAWEGHIFKGWTDLPDGVVAKYQPSEEITVTESTALYAVWESNQVERSGQCGENVIWELDVDYNLTISGTGEMWDYDRNGGPWVEYAFDSLTIGNGILLISAKTLSGTEPMILISPFQTAWRGWARALL